MPSLRFHPSGRLFLDTTETGDSHDPELAPLRPVFESSWCEGLFMLAADPCYQHASAPTRFWREIASDYLAKVCHLPDDAPGDSMLPPTDHTLSHWRHSRPPMTGGEYVTEPLLAKVWHELAAWGASAVATAGGLAAFLETHAPAWRRVGRVTFHLAENRRNPMLPFAFMASFTTGLDSEGQALHLPLRRALEMHAGARNKAALHKLLSPVHEAAQRLDWVHDLVDSGDIYRPMAWSVERAYAMIHSLVQLDAAGLVVRLPSWSHQTLRPKVTVTIETKGESLVGSDAILDFNLGVTLDGKTLTPTELNELLAGDGHLVLFKGRWIEIERGKLQQAMDHWNGVETELTLHEGLRLLAGAPSDLKGSGDPSPDWLDVVAGNGLQELLTGMRDPSALAPLKAGRLLNATLRPYQQEGVNWLRLVTGLGLGACLADDMGLGKTLQVLALLSLNRRQRKAKKSPPSLLIVPASLLGNWQAEAARFTPSLKLLFLHPTFGGRAALDAVAADPERRLAGHDLVVTTYGMAHRLTWLADHTWDLVILDEAQAVKNHGTQQNRAVRTLTGRARVALTGTPIENSLADLWSLFDFLNPGLLGSTAVFKRFVRGLEQRSGGSYEPLRRLVKPYILRRMKTDPTVISDLPDKTETLRYCRLTRTQAAHYQKVVQDLEESLRTMDQGIERRGLVLQCLLRLKQICNHPSQLTGDGEYKPKASGKFDQLEEICGELAARQEKVLVFTQFKEIIPALENHLARVFGRAGFMLHGGTPVKKRAAMVERFQRDVGPPFMILSLKAGGTGLNLTAASHVIHFDRWWNPAVENQATDRAFRIGQRRNVVVHKFVTTGTIEERIDKLLGRKQKLADDLLGGAEVKLTEMSDEDLVALVRLDVTRALG